MNKSGRRGEIWLAEINDKRRPVVILDNDTMIAEIDRMVASVTSQQPRNEYDVVLEQWEEAGLDKPSVVRCTKINTLHYDELIFKIGKLQDNDLYRVFSRIREYFAM